MFGPIDVCRRRRSVLDADPALRAPEVFDERQVGRRIPLVEAIILRARQGP